MVRVFFSYREHEAKVKALPASTTVARLYEVIDDDDHLSRDFVVRRIKYGNLTLSRSSTWTLGNAAPGDVHLDIAEFRLRSPGQLARFVASDPSTAPFRRLGRFRPFSTAQSRTVSDEFTTSMRTFTAEEKQLVADGLGRALRRPIGDTRFRAPDGFYSQAEMESLSQASGYTVDELLDILDNEQPAGSYKEDLVHIMLGEQNQAEMQTRAGIQAFQMYHGTFDPLGPYALTTTAVSKMRSIGPAYHRRTIIQ